MAARDEKYTEFLKIVRDHPEWREALDKHDNEVGENSLRALLAVLAITGLVTSSRAKIIIEVLGALLVVSVYLKKNVLADPRVKDFLEKAFSTLTENGKRYFDVVYSFFENKIKNLTGPLRH